MYEEWMDGIPLPVEGCYEYNIAQYIRASNYHKEHENEEMAKLYEEAAREERIKLAEYNSLGFWSKLKRRILNG